MQLPIRVDKYLRDSTTWSLKALREACVGERVVIHASPDDARGSANRVTAADPSTLVYPGQAVTLDGQLKTRRTQYDYLMLHKPVGVTTTRSDPDGQEDLSVWLRQMPAGVFPVGRLDRMTSGLLLFTSDGDFAQALLLPVHHVEKRYRLVIDHSIQTRDSRLRTLEHGVRIAGEEQSLAATVLDVYPNGNGTTTIMLGLLQGRHRQIRKMCHAVGLRLLALHRSAVGSLELGDLAPGAFSSLESIQVEALWRAAGGRDWIRERQLRALQRRARAAAAAGAPVIELERWLEMAHHREST